MTTEPVPVSASLGKIGVLRENVECVIRGKDEVVRLVTAAMLARGHILLEDVPGVGKTTLAHALATSVSLDFQRVQFTSDLLPADIIGVTIYNQEEHEFEFVRGPIFTNVLLADEINRATPKTQSALLEAMNESMVTIEKQRLTLPDPFLVIATQNPIEHVGTYPLPESQLDRFLMKVTLGYPSGEDERQILRTGGGQTALESMKPTMTVDELLELQDQTPNVHVEERLVDYMMEIVHATRSHPSTTLGVSTRGALAYFRACQALAMVRERDFVTPDDVKDLAVPVLSHRIVLATRGVMRPERDTADRIVQKIVDGIAVPR
ncbi:MAG: MoxR family ATPase [Thermoanaerobaculia bacterium]|nr:MoxR family ATPase [Thermoanaerobaculia bacterium]